MMKRWRGLVAVVVPAVVAWMVAAASPLEARTLRDEIQNSLRSFSSDIVLPGATIPVGRQPEVADAVSDAVQRLSVRGTDFPVASTVPGFSYVYDPTLQAFTKSARLGPVFAEKTETVGSGRFEVGASYLYAALDKVDGRDFNLAEGLVPSLTADVTLNGQVFHTDIIEQLKITSFRLETHSLNLYATYGITDRWDVNVLLPLNDTKLRMRGDLQYVLRIRGTANDLFNSERPVSIRADGDVFGVGDLLLRTKYRLIEGDFGLAAVLAVRVPTGNEENFQGLGDVTVTPTLVASVPIGPVSFHGTAGFEVNADDLQRTRARYTLGGAYQVIENLAVLVDVLGSSSLVDDTFDGLGTAKGLGPDNGTLVVSKATLLPSSPFVPQSNIIDVATGLKVSLGSHALAFIGAIVPLTRDGMRADVIPTGGIEVGF